MKEAECIDLASKTGIFYLLGLLLCSLAENPDSNNRSPVCIRNHGSRKNKLETAILDPIALPCLDGKSRNVFQGNCRRVPSPVSLKIGLRREILRNAFHA